eukprot:1097702-Pleurochrysis_carterae.AAC.16
MPENINAHCSPRTKTRLERKGCTTVFDKRPLQEAGGLRADGGEYIITNGSSIRNCSAPLGNTLSVTSAVVTYVFPTAAGYWLPQIECRVYREICPSNGLACLENRDACSKVIDDVNGSAPVGCTPSSVVQPCPWKLNPSLLLKRIYQLPVSDCAESIVATAPLNTVSSFHKFTEPALVG